MKNGDTDNGNEAADTSRDDNEKAIPLSASAEASRQAESPLPEREAGFKDYIRVFSYAKKWDVILFAAAAIASVGAGVTLPLMNVVLGRLVGNFNQAQQGSNSNLNQLSLYMLALFVARFGLSYINKFSFRIIGIRMSAAVRLHYLRSLFGQTVHVLDSLPSGAAATTITSTSNTLQMGISEKLGTFIEFSATIIAAIIIAFANSWSIALVTCSMILFILLVFVMLLPFVIKGFAKLSKAETRAGAVATEALGAIRMITSCGAEDRTAQKYAECVQEARQASQSTSPVLAAQSGLVMFSLHGAFALAFWYGIKSYYEGRIDNVGTVVIVLMSVMLMVMSMQSISVPVMAASKAMVAASDFFAVIDTPRPKVGTLKEPDVNSTSDIVFTNVHFAYPIL